MPALEDVIPLHLTTVVFPDNHPLRGQTGEVFGFAVRHGGGLVLFDTGVGVGHRLVDQYYQPVHHDLAEALAAHEHRLGDVTAIVNSHLHFDHCGNNSLFPGVPIYAQAPELEATKDRWYTVPEWVAFEGAEYRTIDGEVEACRGIRIIPTPGHTVGHQSVVLDTKTGPIVLAGQAVYSRAQFESIVETGALPEEDPPPDPEAALSSAQQLIALKPRRVHFSHDHEVWEPKA